jgi:hypothetical protein
MYIKVFSLHRCMSHGISTIYHTKNVKIKILKKNNHRHLLQQNFIYVNMSQVKTESEY